jgi:hypothetical protein
MIRPEFAPSFVQSCQAPLPFRLHAKKRGAKLMVKGKKANRGDLGERRTGLPAKQKAAQLKISLQSGL